MLLSTVTSSDFAVLFQQGLVARRGRGTTLYRRAGTSWQRRVSYSDHAETWVTAKRVPKEVREVGEANPPPAGDLQVEFSNITRVAVRRESWRS